MNQALPIRSILIANRGEIAIRIMRAAAEMGLRTVAIYAREDRFSLHRFKADESYPVGAGAKPIAAYLDIKDILRIAREAEVDAIHPGYGFLSENPDFAEACETAGIRFIGPSPAVLRTLGDKVSARQAAEAAQVPVLPASPALPADLDECKRILNEIGYPIMLKASWGGGGRGMRVIENEAELETQLASARSESKAAFGNDETYAEKLIRNARHVEVQVLGDTHGNLVHLFERDCSVQRRHQKVVERAPAPYFDQAQRDALCASALRLCRSVGYANAGTVEFLLDADSGQFYFIEVNPRIQVEHTVTEEVTGVDIVKAQIKVAAGMALGDHAAGLPQQEDIHLNGHALQCRVTTEDPENGFTPDHGRLIAYRSPSGFGIRLDGGTAYSGAVITPYYDSMLVKVTAWAPTPDEAVARMDRCLREFRIRGLSTNLQFLENVIGHDKFLRGDYTTRFIDSTPELFEFTPRKDRATKLLRFIGDVVVNGSPEMKGREAPQRPLPEARLPQTDLDQAPADGLRQILLDRGAQGFARWMQQQEQVLLTDTTLRDAHQSLFATRMRSRDMLAVAPHYARLLPGLLSLECWGGATFDVAMRFLKEDPWERLQALREAIPNIPFQMLLRSANAVGYTNYADNVVEYFIQQAAHNGIDIFRIFDCLNNTANMHLPIRAVAEAGGVAEAAICYTGDLFDPARPKYNLDYYLNLARDLEKAGAHILAIKDMAGVCRPRAAHALVSALKQEIDLPIHFHTHDTSGIAAASVLAAIDAGCDAVDGALDAMSGLTSQPNLGSIAAALQHSDKAAAVDPQAMRQISDYWEDVRRYYAPFESDIRSGTADVYQHEMPGGQYTNLREQARALGLGARWPEVSRAYAQVNQMFGDIVKVTPSSKVVGDMALYMVGKNIDPDTVADPDSNIDFPESVISLFRGELGTPPDGWPQALQQRVLRGEAAMQGRPGEHLPAVDLDQARQELAKQCDIEVSDTDLASWLMYPKVFEEFISHRKLYGDVSTLPTETFFYGLQEQEEIGVDIARGKRLIIRLQSITHNEDDGITRLFYELNGQSRVIRVENHQLEAIAGRAKADPAAAGELGAPMAGMVVRIAVQTGDNVRKGDALITLEAMKMETVIAAPADGRVAELPVAAGSSVDMGDLLVKLES